jgi:catechol 2,3-dioxygenase-like lactoylglutathione lyase family enzyme
MRLEEYRGAMRATGVTVGIPVRDLDRATAWYRSAFQLGDPDLQPVEGLVEFDLGPFWLQLAHRPQDAGGRGITVNLSVADAGAERQRLADLGHDVSDLERYEGVVEFFELRDPDGNTIGFVTELT